MEGQRVTRRGTLPKAKPTPTTRAPDGTPLPMLAFVGKIPVKQADGTVTEQLSWIIPAEHTEKHVQCSECSYPMKDRISICPLCGSPRHVDIALQKSDRHEMPAKRGFSIPIHTVVLAVMVCLACWAVRSPFPILLVLGVLALPRLGVVSMHTSKPQLKLASSK